MNQSIEKRQFSLQTIFWIMIASAMLLAYARSLGKEAMDQAIQYALLSLIIGGAIGWITLRFWDALFWSFMLNLLAFLAIAGGRLTNDAIVFGWGIVGAFCGGLASMDAPKPNWVGPLLSSIAACVMMVFCIMLFQVDLNGPAQFDIGCAAFIGAIVHPSIQFLKWFETESKHPRALMAAWMTIFVLIGNVLVPILTGAPR